MSESRSQTEARLTETFRAAAAQVDPTGDGFERIRRQVTSPDDTGPDQKRPLWLAAAALFLVVGGFGLTRIDLDELPGTTSAGLDESISGDGRLFLLPPEGTDLSGELFYSTEPTVDQGSAMVVGRPTDTGFENLAWVAHLTTGPTFAGSEVPIEIAGRDLIEPASDVPGSVAAEELPDGTWIEYTIGFGSARLDEIVAATSFTDDQLMFTTTPSGVEMLGRIADVSTPRGTLMSHDRQEPATDSEAPPLDSFSIITMPAESDELLILAVLATSIDRIGVQGQPGYVARLPELDGQPSGTGLAWLYPTGHVVVVLTDLPEDETIDFAERLRIVDGKTWNAELSSIGQAPADGNTAPSD